MDLGASRRAIDHALSAGGAARRVARGSRRGRRRRRRRRQRQRDGGRRLEDFSGSLWFIRRNVRYDALANNRSRMVP